MNRKKYLCRHKKNNALYIISQALVFLISDTCVYRIKRKCSSYQIQVFNKSL